MLLLVVVIFFFVCVCRSACAYSQSFQLGEPLWTDPGLKSGTSVRELISTLKKKKSAQAGNELSNILPKSSQARKNSPSPVGDKSCQRVYFVFINDTIRDPEMSSMQSLLTTLLHQVT